MLLIRLIFALTVLLSTTCLAQTLPLPARTTSLISTADFIRQIEPLILADREEVIAAEILRGNVPASLTHLHAINLTHVTNGRTNSATIFVSRDYLGIGNDEDYLITPLTPNTAQRIADELGCTLATRKIVDAIYSSAGIRLVPQPIPPSAAMTTVPVFASHNQIVQTQLLAFGKSRISNSLIAGHKKDVVVSGKLAALTNKVAIYGWHQTNGKPIQPLYTGHSADWVDYSHGIRLVQQSMIVNGAPTTAARVLVDPGLSGLLSDEGVITHSRYVRTDSKLLNSPHPVSLPEPTHPQPLPGGEKNIERAIIVPFLGGVRGRSAHQKEGDFAERITNFSPAPEVKVEIHSPSAKHFEPDKPVLLILYALPNGNTTAQTIGKKPRPGDDWHFDIQHIGAQTRFLRAAITNRTLVIAYLETEMKSWPAWRRKHGDKLIPEIIATIKQPFATNKLELVLTGHSGGGSLTFGYLNAVPEISRDIKRIAFLDSNYAYETTNHFAKLVNWLKQTDEAEASLTNRSVPVPGHSNVVSPISSGQSQSARNLNIAAPEDGRTPPGEGYAPHLCVLAYHDSIALQDGKTFVSERGGTWGRSHAMLVDLQQEFPFTSSTNSAGLQSHVAANGRIQFLLKENPDRKVLHTVQVDRNGFIHALLTGTLLENNGYEFFGERAYERWIRPP